MLKNTLVWYYLHKKLMALVMTMVAAITTAALIFAHDCYNSALFKNQEGEYKVRLERPVSLNEFEKRFVSVASDSGIEFQYLNVGSGRGTCNTSCYSTYLSKPTARYMYGSLPENPGEIMQYVSVVNDVESDINLFEIDFKVTGCGLLEYCDADYVLYPSDFEANVGSVEYFSTKIQGSNKKDFRVIVEKSLGNAEIQAFTGIDIDSVMSRKNVIISYIVLIVSSIVFAVIIVKIAIEMQKKDIFVYFVCGGNIRKIIQAYWFSALLLTIIAEALGLAVFEVLKPLNIFTYSECSSRIPATLVLVTQSITISISVFLSVKTVCKRLSRNFREVMS